MSVTNITVYQDNIDGDCNLLAIHNPLIFLIDVEYSGAAPQILCDMYYDHVIPDDNPNDTFTLAFDTDISATQRRYRLTADELLRAHMDTFEDTVQAYETVEIVQNIQKKFTLRLYDSDETEEQIVYIVAFHASRQFGENPALTDIYNNEDTIYIAGYNFPVYIYFYNDDPGAEAYITDGLNDYSLGSESIYLLDDLDDWEGYYYSTYPKDWVLLYDPGTYNDQRMYEISSGIGMFKMNNHWNPSNYSLLSIYRPSIEIEPGETNWWCEIKYRKGGNNALFVTTTRMVGGGPMYIKTQLLPYSDDWTTVDFEISNMFSNPVKRNPLIGFYQIKNLYQGVYECEIDYIKIYRKASAKEYYRLKLDNITQDTTFEFYQNSLLKATKTVVVKPMCNQNKVLKYLDSNGQYRFVICNQYWEMRDNPTLLGKTNKIITSILNDQSDARVVGYKNERKLTLVAENISKEELEIISDIYTSPCVYIYIGDGTSDLKTDWLQVTINAQDNIVKNKKGDYVDIIFDVTLPKQYTITLL